jgi:phage gp37-like protein
MSFRVFRDAVIAKMKADIVVDVQNQILNRPFREVKPAPRRVDEQWLERVIEWTPSIHIAWIGSARGIERNHLGQIVGPWALVAHVVAAGRAAQEPEDVLLDRLHTLALYIDGNRWDFGPASPALVTDIENLWDIQSTDQGYAIGSIMWHQEVAFGDNLLEIAESQYPVNDGAGNLIDLPPWPPAPNTLYIDPSTDPFGQPAYPEP